MSRNYFMLFYDFIEETEMLTDEERGRLVKAILQFARDGEADESALVGNERFLYPHFRRQAERDAEAYARRATQNAENGKKGGRPRKADQDAENPMGFSETEKSQYKYKDEYEDKDEGEDKDEAPVRARRDAPHAPALDDVRDFCRENELQTDPQTFWNYYQANGWRAGEHPIRDWQAKLREWDARGTAGAPSRFGSARAAPANPALNYAQRDYADDDRYYVDLDAYDNGQCRQFKESEYQQTE